MSVDEGDGRRLPRRAILAASCFGMVTLSYGTAAPAVALTAIATALDFGRRAQGMFLGSMFAGMAIAVLIAGPLADRCGFRPFVVLSGVFQCLGLLVVSRATADARWLAPAGMFIVGLGAGFTDALVTPLVCAVYPERRTRVSNLLHAFYPIGLVFAILIMLGLMRIGWSWERQFALLGWLALPYALAMFLLPLPRHSHEGPARAPTRRLVLTGPFIILFFGIFLAGVTELGPSSWLPAFVEGAAGDSRAQGGLGLLAFGVTMAVGRLFISTVVHRLGARRLFVISGAFCCASLLLASWPLGPWFKITWLAVLGLAVSGFWPTILGCAGDQFPKAGASLFSLLSAAGLGGGVAGPVAIGFIADHHSLNIAMAVLAVVPVIALILLSRLPAARAAVGPS